MALWYAGWGVALFVWSFINPGVGYIPAFSAGVLVAAGVIEIGRDR